ncbi:MAG: signal peptidase I [bacterium]|nr:signal peptidase I [bacterium]
MGDNEVQERSLAERLVDDFVFPFAVFLFVFGIGLRLITASRIPYFIVPTKSMYPVIKPGDILFSEGWTLNAVKPGDIVVFRAYDALRHRWLWVVHRVIRLVHRHGKVYLITAGDYNLQLCKQHHEPEVYCYDNGSLYPDTGLPLVHCPLFGKLHGFCVAGVVLEINGQPLKLPYIGKLLLGIRNL